MLRSFRVANHKSIKDEQELLLVPAYDKTRPALPVAAIFGANAAGKSNMLDALRWMRAAVDDSYGRWRPGAGVPRHPFRLDSTSLQAGSLYSVEFVTGEVRHTYGFLVDDSVVREEWLYAYPNSNRRRIIFEREGQKWTFGSTVARARFELLRELTRDNALFLSVAAQSGAPETAAASAWFQQLRFGKRFSKGRVPEIINYLESSPARRHTLVSLVQAADLGIADVRSQEPTRDETTGLTLRKPDLEFVHGESGVAMPTWRQSDGTLNWLSFLEAALTALDQGSLLCIDEIDASLHPRLTPRLIELFRSPQTNVAGAQLIFTTHDATLLSTSFGEDILNRDEIWFVQKGADGSTALYPLTDFHPRKDENTERRYLGGSYGGVPSVSEYEFRQALTAEVEAA
jgi:hypothetical protein